MKPRRSDDSLGFMMEIPMPIRWSPLVTRGSGGVALAVTTSHDSQIPIGIAASGSRD